SQACTTLPVDVAARFRKRTQIVVGNLKSEETRSLVDAYLGDRPQKFASEMGQYIHQPAGRSPREVLRIAHHAFKRTDGNFSIVSKDVLLQSAQLSGSID